MDGLLPPSLSAERRLQGAKILIAEDDPVTRAMLDDFLSAEGFKIYLANDGAEALQINDREKVDLLLLDVMMPIYDGFEVCRRCKDAARMEGRFLPVLFLTALAQRASRMQGLALGADDYLTKPFHRTEVLLRVRGLLATKFLYDDIVDRYEALSRLEDMQRRLTTFVVHDLKNPLTGLMANLQLLERESGKSLTERSQGFLKDARASAKRLFELVATILDISRMEEGAIPLSRVELQVESAFRSGIEDFEASAEAKELTIDLVVPDDLPPCQADQRMIVRVIANLVGNAVRHTPRGRKIMLTAASSTDRSALLLSVIDDAPRIPMEHQSLIFQKFGRVEAAGGGAGHGLGLTFCRLAAEAHGGDIWVQGAESGGNQFVVSLPVVSSY